MEGPTPDQRKKRKGIAVESLVTALCVLGSDGELNAATSLVDDEGVDLVLFRVAGGATMSLQVKATFAYSASVTQGPVRFGVKRPSSKGTFKAREDFFLLFLIIDHIKTSIEHAWLVPSTDFMTQLENNTALTFATSLSGSDNRWAKYKIHRDQLAGEILQRVQSLE